MLTYFVNSRYHLTWHNAKASSTLLQRLFFLSEDLLFGYRMHILFLRLPSSCATSIAFIYIEILSWYFRYIDYFIQFYQAVIDLSCFDFILLWRSLMSTKFIELILISVLCVALATFEEKKKTIQESTFFFSPESR